MESLRNVRVHVEFPYFFYGFALMFDASISSNFLLYRTCYVTLGYDRNECSLIGTDHANNETKQLENKVQEYTTQILLCRTLVEAFIPPILCLFLAHWSDKYGRKPLMLFGITSLLMSYVIMTIISLLPYVSPWYFLLIEFPSCLGGSKVTLLTACLSYISDVTPEENRGIRLGFLDAAVNIGMLLGTVSSSYVFNAFGYTTIYGTCIVCQFCAWMFTFFYIPESVESNETEGKWRALFDVSPLRETVKILFKQRTNNDRPLLLCLFSLFALYIAGRYADSNVIYLYLLKKFNWTLQRYTIYLAISQVTWVIFCLCSVILLVRLLRLKETILIVIAVLFSTFAALLQGFATRSWQIYTATIVKSMSSYIAPMSQSLLSRVVSKEENGKLFASLVTFQTVSLLLSTSLNTYVYNKTLETFPQAFNFVTVGLYGMTLAVAISVSILHNQGTSALYSLLVNEYEEER